jgi:hypothetical protein
MASKKLHETYAHKSCADIAVRTFNLYVPGGRTAFIVEAGPGQYQVWIEECPSSEEFFFGSMRRAA